MSQVGYNENVSLTSRPTGTAWPDG